MLVMSLTPMIFYVAFNFPVKDHEGEFIGVGGVDILLDAIGSIINSVNYKDTGHAILMDKNGGMLFFSEVQNTAKIDTESHRLTESVPLESLDKKDGNRGFSDLQQSVKNNFQGQKTIQFQGDRYLAQFRTIGIDYLNFTWKLAILVPMEVVEAPVNKAIKSSILVISGILLVLVAILYWATKATLGPLVNLKQALSNISSGAGDLSQRIDCQSQDEIGELAQAFNQFISQVQNIVKEVKETTEHLHGTTKDVVKVSQVTVERAKQSFSEIGRANGIVSGMADMADSINERIASAQNAAQAANEATVKGQEVLEGSMQDLELLNNDFHSAADTMGELRDGSVSIGAVVDVIRGCGTANQFVGT